MLDFFVELLGARVLAQEEREKKEQEKEERRRVEEAKYLERLEEIYKSSPLSEYEKKRGF